MKILFLANLVPYPLDGGGKIATFSMIKALSKYHEIDLLSFYEHEDIEAAKKELSKYCNEIEFLSTRVTTKENMSFMLRKAVKSLFSMKPLAVSKYYSIEMQNSIECMMLKNNYDCVLISLLVMAVYADSIIKQYPNIKLVLYEQNCEALIYKRLYKQEKNILKKLFVGYEYVKLKRFEQKIIKTVNKVIVLSVEDSKNLGLNNPTVIPIGVQPQSYHKEYSERDNNKVKMLFIGTMTWAPNNEGIIWFLSNVMPLCSNGKAYDLTIVGKGVSKEVKKLTEKYENVHVLGYVEKLEDVYDEADVLVVPLFIGSGQRVKIIEAFAKNFAVISTTIGAEGLYYKDGETILIADTAEDFKKEIDKCKDTGLLKRIAAGGKTVFDTNYSTEVVAIRLNEAILE